MNVFGVLQNCASNILQKKSTRLIIITMSIIIAMMISVQYN